MAETYSGRTYTAVESAEPLAKRLRGELLSATEQHLKDVQEVKQSRNKPCTGASGSTHHDGIMDSWLILVLAPVANWESLLVLVLDLCGRTSTTRSFGVRK